MIKFNEDFIKKLDIKTQQTEIKLIEGLNNSLKEKFEIKNALKN